MANRPRTPAAERQRRRRERQKVSVRVYPVPLPSDVLLAMAMADEVPIELLDEPELVGEAIARWLAERHA